ncbi:MAG: hypothetical protein ACRD1G_06940 [Acidimicrobiales bacterium]
MDWNSHRHEGSFAAGQALMEHHPEFPTDKGSFATGEARRIQTHQGTYAEGQERADPHPEVLENRGGFAAGQRTPPAPEIDGQLRRRSRESSED